MLRLFLFFLTIPKIIFSTELNLICTNNYIDVRSLDVKDVFLIINTDNKKIDLGGLSFYADVLKKTESNISWSASDIELFPNSNGNISGIIGRYSGQLVLNFQKESDGKISSLSFNCKKFEVKEKKF
ncbi:MAG: hypothetical protein CL572_06885 [Alphaproteobacteria bacterium]|nr:hypothetical protein [Alphaproteobacteria bacterium]|tara:strand:+ start:1444 stop:1824 length:381 start_codon:yes stop_codon:yes gene_type:complete